MSNSGQIGPLSFPYGCQSRTWWAHSWCIMIRLSKQKKQRKGKESKRVEENPFRTKTGNVITEGGGALKIVFGREDLLGQIYVCDLLSLVLKNATTGKNAPDLANLYDMLETKLRALESLGRTKETFADFLEPLEESCLRENVLRAWERRKISESTDEATSQRSLGKLMCFLRHEVESEEIICLACEGFGKDRGSGEVVLYEMIVRNRSTKMNPLRVR
ncbi:integrase catalytic domain-containing protein [Trichonephila clavipes]|nr:integrase catalytic domain-containing protein [Trichonephila clavipes]